MYNHPGKAAQTSFCKMIFITTQRNQLMIPVSMCIFSAFCNKEKSKVRTRVSLNLQTAHFILKNRFSYKEPCGWNWLFSLASISATGGPNPFMQSPDRQFKYLTQHWKILGFSLKREEKMRVKTYRQYIYDTTFEEKCCNHIEFVQVVKINTCSYDNSSKICSLSWYKIYLFHFILQHSDENKSLRKLLSLIIVDFQMSASLLLSFFI